MGTLFWQSITDPLRVFCNILVFVIPYMVYKINQRLHKFGDPAWKKKRMSHSKKENE